MISLKGKRRIICNGQTYFWYVKVSDGRHRVIIVSPDKRYRAEFPFEDTECAVTPKYVRECIERSLKE